MLKVLLQQNWEGLLVGDLKGVPVCSPLHADLLRLFEHLPDLLNKGSNSFSLHSSIYAFRCNIKPSKSSIKTPVSAAQEFPASTILRYQELREQLDSREDADLGEGLRLFRVGTSSRKVQGGREVASGFSISLGMVSLAEKVGEPGLSEVKWKANYRGR